MLLRSLLVVEVLGWEDCIWCIELVFAYLGLSARDLGFLDSGVHYKHLGALCLKFMLS